MSVHFLALFEAMPPKVVDANSVLFRAGDAVAFLHLVQEGCVALERHLESGVVTCLQRARSGMVLAEASIYAQHYHCAARSLEPTIVRAVPVADFRNALRRNAQLAEDWAQHLARTVQETRFQSELRGIRTVADRLDAWLAEYGDLPPKGQWKSLAAELAVSPEALYRDVARRRLGA